MRHRQTDRQRHRQTERETDRQTDRQTERQRAAVICWYQLTSHLSMNGLAHVEPVLHTNNHRRHHNHNVLLMSSQCYNHHHHHNHNVLYSLFKAAPAIVRRPYMFCLCAFLQCVHIACNAWRTVIALSVCPYFHHIPVFCPDEWLIMSHNLETVQDTM